MSDQKHWAYESWKRLNDAGIKISETRFDDKISRGEVFSLLDRMMQVLSKEPVKPTPPPNPTPPPVVNTKKIEFIQSQAGTRILKGNIDQLGCVVYPNGKSNKSITERNCVNGTFFTWGWHDSTKKVKDYSSTSPLIVNGKAYRWACNHGKPQSCFIIYKDNTVEMKRIKNINELDTGKIKYLFGGLGLINKSDKSFSYSPSSEGFVGEFADILRPSPKTVIAYKASEKKIYLLIRDIIHQSSGYDLIDVCNDYGFDIAMSVDGGGSTFMNYQGQNKFSGDGRGIHNSIVFEE